MMIVCHFLTSEERGNGPDLDGLPTIVAGQVGGAIIRQG
jgi:hypothetical protein